MGVNLLMSYAFCADTDLAAVRSGMVCGRLMIDSGAFTVWSRGITIDRVAYAEYLERWAGQWDHAITLDVIGDPAATSVNTRWLHQRGLPVMPVFTKGMTLADFDAMVTEAGYVCVGGLVGLVKKHQVARLTMLQRRAVDLGGGIHALGIGSVDIIRAARPYSVDASTPTTVIRYGNIVIFDGRMLRQVHVASRPALAKHRDIIRANGIDVAGLAKAGRIPNRDGGATLAVSMAMSYIVADEYVKQKWAVPPPGGLGDPGPHLYHSTDSATAVAVAQLDHVIHGPNAWPQWSIHGRKHLCSNRKDTP